VIGELDLLLWCDLIESWRDVCLGLTKRAIEPDAALSIASVKLR